MASGDMRELHRSQASLHLAMYLEYLHVCHTTWIGSTTLLPRILLNENSHVRRKYVFNEKSSLNINKRSLWLDLGVYIPRQVDLVDVHDETQWD